jgi:hypothetical protein
LAKAITRVGIYFNQRRASLLKENSAAWIEEKVIFEENMTTFLIKEHS